MDAQQLQDFALGDAVGGIGEYPHDAQVSCVHHHLERAGVEEVADEDTGGISEHGIRRGSSAPQIRLVDHVVVQQGGGVDELDDGGEQHMGGAFVAERPRDQQHHGRTQALAARANDVVGDRVDQSDIGVQSLADDGVDGLHVGRDRGQHGPEVRNGVRPAR